MAKIDALFRFMMEQGASDLHLSVGSPPVLRISGEMVPMRYRPLTSEYNQALLTEILSDEQKLTFEKSKDVDFAYELGDEARFRGNLFVDRQGPGGVFRHVPSKVLTAKDLGLPPVVLQLAELKKGLVLVTGPTGSGKSTTLAAMVDHINKTRREHIITVEDPIEFVHENQMALVNQREVCVHTDNFAAALKASLREDPDVILVGEMRDLETIKLALTAAETGHLVFGTLHTSSAPKTVDRLIQVFPAQEQAFMRVLVSESLKGVISQNLLKRVDKRGRVAAMEIMVVTPAVSNLIREAKTFQIKSTMQTSRQVGMQTMDQALLDLAMARKISMADARNTAEDKSRFQGNRRAV